VPALLATVLAQLVMGRQSVTAYQQTTRVGHLERRLRLPVRTALTTDVRPCAPGTPLKMVWDGQAGSRNPTPVPVVDHGQPVGLVSPDYARNGSTGEATTLTAADVMRTDVPVADGEWTLGTALAAMEASGSDLLPVAEHGKFVGVVTRREIIRVDEILDEIEND
jgi:CBS domain-containing protein